VLGNVPPEIYRLFRVEGTQATMGFEADTEAATFTELIEFGDDATAFTVAVTEFGGCGGFLPGLVTAVTSP
jgi:hypothetical protein